MSRAGLSISVAAMTLRHANGTVALDRVSLELGEGSICAIMGASGSGKSSLLATIGGRAMACQGRILLGGTLLLPQTLPGLRPMIGQVYQDHRLVRQSSVLANVLAGAAATLPLWRVLTDRYPTDLVERAGYLLDLLGLDESFLSRRLDSLSGGQAQRVGIARALIGGPRLILADEPVASLDPPTALRALRAISSVARETGATVVCALHQPDLAASFAQRIIHLQKGRIVSADGSVGRDAA